MTKKVSFLGTMSIPKLRIDNAAVHGADNEQFPCDQSCRLQNFAFKHKRVVLVIELISRPESVGWKQIEVR